jgi:hypothetical protein
VARRWVVREDRWVERTLWKAAGIREVGSKVAREVVQACKVARYFYERGLVVGVTRPGKKFTCCKALIALRTIIRSMHSLSPIFLS